MLSQKPDINNGQKNCRYIYSVNNLCQQSTVRAFKADLAIQTCGPRGLNLPVRSSMRTQGSILDVLRAWRNCRGPRYFCEISSRWFYDASGKTLQSNAARMQRKAYLKDSYRCRCKHCYRSSIILISCLLSACSFCRLEDAARKIMISAKNKHCEAVS